MPRLIRYSFAGFAIVLAVVGGALIMQTPNVFPWPLLPESSVLFGLIYLGAAVYFTYAVFQPAWRNAAGQLAGFLIYDLILIGPFLQHFSSVRPENLISLVIYTAVIIYSAILAGYYLLINRSTHLGAAAPV